MQINFRPWTGDRLEPPDASGFLKVVVQQLSKADFGGVSAPAAVGGSDPLLPPMLLLAISLGGTLLIFVFQWLLYLLAQLWFIAFWAGAGGLATLVLLSTGVTARLASSREAVVATAVLAVVLLGAYGIARMKRSFPIVAARLQVAFGVCIVGVTGHTIASVGSLSAVPADKRVAIGTGAYSLLRGLEEYGRARRDGQGPHA